MRVKIATAGDGACFGGGEGIGVTGVKYLKGAARLGRERRTAGCNEVLAVMVVVLDGCDRHGSGPAPAHALALFGSQARIFMPLHGWSPAVAHVAHALETGGGSRLFPAAGFFVQVWRD
ncbi:MAG: hypothetical protein HOQ25_21535 [Mesorhizobium sp.]|nr:hypothetical protein [Mesorhizobium sp.]